MTNGGRYYLQLLNTPTQWRDVSQAFECLDIAWKAADEYVQAWGDGRTVRVVERIITDRVTERP